MGRVAQTWAIDPTDKVEVMRLQLDPNAQAPLYEAAKARGASLPQLQKAKFSTVKNTDKGTTDLVLEWHDGK
jgi:hypothetical protein